MNLIYPLFTCITVKLNNCCIGSVFSYRDKTCFAYKIMRCGMIVKDTTIQYCSHEIDVTNDRQPLDLQQ